MAPNDRVFHKSYGPELLRLAEADLAVANVLAGAAGIRSEIILFHVQQAVEKATKAVLCIQGRPVPMTHDLYAVVQRFDAADLPPGGFALHDLSPYATIRRYEEGVFALTQQEISSSLALAKDVLAWAKRRCVP